MKKKISISLFIFLISVFCLFNIFINCDSQSRFRNAWNRNDTTYVKNYIKNLKNKDVEEVGAIAETVLSTYTNFAYGMMFFEERHGNYFWDTISENQKEIIKYNIIMVWNIYMESDLFMKKGCKGVILIDGKEKTFHDLYHPNRKRKFLLTELVDIKIRMNKVAKKCIE